MTMTERYDEEDVVVGGLPSGVNEGEDMGRLVMPLVCRIIARLSRPASGKLAGVA